MAGEQPSEQSTVKPVASETENIERFAEHVNERKRKRNLWGQYVDEQSRRKCDGEKPVHTPDLSVSTKSKGTQTDDTPYVKEPDVDGSTKMDESTKVDGSTGSDDKDVKEESVKLSSEGGDEDGFVKTPCVGGVPEEQDNMDLYEP
ncbi:hypothetical protein J4E83_009831 [Alternaria metachromatica]|uniref:uncharacterized protein n=1 Tax=Alternaria metachromatica TaxID=283354 RepID=UPI0020C2FA0F|nr:uncharacterized protein J4E83_009831 [Alternaria metachromatica]KAI4606920.1 hypothetical protein J4E83_009831 [Alternaria metachromatica]